eukprot:10766716-Karenia_brevis.AAC.1
MSGHPEDWESDKGYVHFIGWKSGIIKRQCRSTFRTETQGMTYSTELEVNLRAILAILHGKFEQYEWET